MEFPPPSLDSVALPLRIVGLEKRFGSKVALDHLSISVPHGACYGLVGPNGSGKSTTMRSVVGLARPDSGTIEVCGRRRRHGCGGHGSRLARTPEIYGAIIPSS